MGKLVWIIVLATSIWVLGDAQTIGVKRGQIRGVADMGPWGWFFACLFFWIIGFPTYLAKRNEYKRINSFGRGVDFSIDTIYNGSIYIPPTINAGHDRWRIATDNVKKGCRYIAFAGLFIFIGIVLMGIYFQEYQEITQRVTTALKSVIQRAI